ncbi:MAG: hypothetical protein M3010_11770, partial [Candidatus Dormibacteraeota bacterium]|nr:hypothetical protein [Candidatus Dormibacteraeota bacterium]
MGVAQYLTGLALGAAALAPILAGAAAVRRRLAPELTGPPAWVATIVLVLALLVLALELVGVLGLLHRWGAAVGCAALGFLAWLLARRGAAAATDQGAVRDGRGLEHWAILVALAVLAAPWLAWTIFAYRHGMETVDTLWYHLPFAARFTQLGSIVHR